MSKEKYTKILSGAVLDQNTVQMQYHDVEFEWFDWLMTVQLIEVIW